MATKVTWGPMGPHGLTGSPWAQWVPMGPMCPMVPMGPMDPMIPRAKYAPIRSFMVTKFIITEVPGIQKIDFLITHMRKNLY